VHHCLQRNSLNIQLDQCYNMITYMGEGLELDQGYMELDQGLELDQCYMDLDQGYMELDQCYICMREGLELDRCYMYIWNWTSLRRRSGTRPVLHVYGRGSGTGSVLGEGLKLDQCYMCTWDASGVSFYKLLL